MAFSRLQLEALESRELLSGNVVLDWNAMALNAIRATAMGPPPASRALAMVSIAMYDTVDLVSPSAPLYPVSGLPAVPAGVSADIAAAAAADRVLDKLFPTQAATFDAHLQSYLLSLQGVSVATINKSVAFGNAVGDAILQWRSGDGAALTVVYTPKTGPGQWQPTPPAFASGAFAQWGGVVPFALSSASEFRPDGPPALTSAEYAAAFNEVKNLGSKTGSTRTADQTQIALFWADGGGTETPPGHWNAIAEQIAAANNDTLAQDARLLAVLNVSLADAAIAAWDVKYTDTFWRPVTAIQAANTDGNPATAPDPTWTPLLVTPAFPSYVSGHSTFSAAAAVVLTGFFGANVGFTTTSDALPGVTRTFSSFMAAAQEAGQSRIYGGIHYQFDNRDGLALGGAIGDYVLHYFVLPQAFPAPGPVQHPGVANAGTFDALDNMLLVLTNDVLPGGKFVAPSSQTHEPGSSRADHVTEAFFLRDLVSVARYGLPGKSGAQRTPAADAAFHLLQADAVAFAFVEGLGQQG